MRLLIADADTLTRAHLSATERDYGWTVEATDSGYEAVEMAQRYGFDVIIAGRELLEMAAFELVMVLRRAGVATPVLVLGTLGMAEQVRALNLGADDAQPLPIHPHELEARLHALVRRGRQAPPVLTIGPIGLDLASREAFLDGRRLKLSNAVYRVLEALAVREGQVVTRGVILDALYAGRDEPDPKIVDVFVCKVRRALGAHAGLIETIWGQGWRLLATPEPPRLPAAGMLEQSFSVALADRPQERSFGQPQSLTPRGSDGKFLRETA